MKEVNITYFAVFRECANKQHETIHTTANTLAELFDQLANTYIFKLKSSEIKVAVNDHYVNFDDAVTTGDHVVFIPPIAGG